MITKYARLEQILECKSSYERVDFGHGEDNFARFASITSSEADGFLYVRCRAISSRVNKNNDAWGSDELKNAYKTFIGRPIFVDHNNSDPKRTRGVIIDARLHEEDTEKFSAVDEYYKDAPDEHKPPTWIELLLEVDAKTYPKLAKAVKKGDIDAVSMGANITKSICNICDNIAESPLQYCKHISSKGAEFEITASNGEKMFKRSYERCQGVNFFEISFVFDPADPTALISEKADRKLSAVEKTSSNSEKVGGIKKMALGNDEQWGQTQTPSEHNERELNYIPQNDLVSKPRDVDTLREEVQCPNCHSGVLITDATGAQKCDACSWVQPPHPLDNPDLTQNPKEESDELTQDNENDAQVTFFSPQSTARINEMKWNILSDTIVLDKTTAVLPRKKIINPSLATKTDDPQNAKVISDQKAPVTSKNDKVENMNEDIKIANEKDESKLLVAFSIADELVSLGALEDSAKLAYVAKLEDKSAEALEATKETIEIFKESGFSKPISTTKTSGLKIPKMASYKSEAVEVDTPMEALFL